MLDGAGGGGGHAWWKRSCKTWRTSECRQTLHSMNGSFSMNSWLGLWELTHLFPILACQRHRCNVPHSNPEEYYRRTIFLLFVDHLMQEMSIRFGSLQQKTATLFKLVPSIIRECESSKDHTATCNQLKEEWGGEKNPNLISTISILPDIRVLICITKLLL